MLRIITALFLLMTCISSGVAATWRCIAVDPGGASWHQYGATRAIARAGAMAKCRTQPMHPTCSTRCYSTSTFWRCTAMDASGKSWAWVAPTKLGAIAKAKSVCLHNSAMGGCKVSPKLCIPSSTTQN